MNMSINKPGHNKVGRGIGHSFNFFDFPVFDNYFAGINRPAENINYLSAYFHDYSSVSNVLLVYGKTVKSDVFLRLLLNKNMRWTLLPRPDDFTTRQLATELGVDYGVAALLVMRGVTTFDQARTFFRPSLQDLHDPYLMKDMDRAVERIQSAISRGERILVFGDYDVDGTTSVAMMSSYLKTIHDKVDTYIPDRYREGYGVSREGIDYAAQTGCRLIIALDCGVKSVELVAYAKSINVDFIICDHHRPGDQLPDAVAILDPKRSDCFYPYDELCGCGVGFKLIQALAGSRGQGIADLLPYLDLVATAIAADIVPITGENRVLTTFGLQVINSTPRPGIKALLGSAENREVCVTDLVFIVAPRINAAGRIKHGKEAVRLLAEIDSDAAKIFAAEIEQYNASRKNLDKKITQEALQQIEQAGEQDRFTTVVYQETWHKGVIGIVASRLIETYYRPTLVFTKSGEKLAASARSVRNFDVYNALEACAEHLEQFGGHMYAAGMTIKEENFTRFKDAFEQVVARTVSPEQLVPEIEIDAEVSFSELTPRFRRLIKQFEPFGPANMAPVFITRGVVDSGFAKCIGEDGTHLKAFLKQGNIGVGAVGFGLGKKADLLSNRQPVDVIYTVEENNWNGTTSLQLRLKDLRRSGQM